MAGLILRLSYVLYILFSIHTSLATEPSGEIDESLASLPFTVPDSLKGGTEEQAKLWCKEDFGLSDTEILTSWKRTYALHNAFWRYHRNKNAIEMLVEVGFPLAVILDSSGKDDFYFYSFDSLKEKLLTFTHEFLSDLPIVEIIKLIRDVIMLNLTHGAYFRSNGLLLEQLREEFYQIPGINDGGRALIPLDLAGPVFLKNAKYIEIISNRLIKACYLNLFSRNSTSFILYLFDLPFTLCLSEMERIDLYEQAQNQYRAQHGRFHSGIFNHSFPIPMFEAINLSIELENSPATPNLDYNVFEILGGGDRSLVKLAFLRLHQRGDSIFSLILGNLLEAENSANRGTPEFDPTYELARLWFTEALNCPATRRWAQQKLGRL